MKEEGKGGRDDSEINVAKKKSPLNRKFRSGIFPGGLSSLVSLAKGWCGKKCVVWWNLNMGSEIIEAGK